MKKNMLQKKEQNKSPERDFNEIKIYVLPDREFKITVRKVLTVGRRAMHEQRENFKHEIETIKMYQIEITELKNTITELTNSIEEFNSRLDQAEESVSKLKNRVVEIVQSEQ